MEAQICFPAPRRYSISKWKLEDIKDIKKELWRAYSYILYNIFFYLHQTYGCTDREKVICGEIRQNVLRWAVFV